VEEGTPHGFSQVANSVREQSCLSWTRRPELHRGLVFLPVLLVGYYSQDFMAKVNQ
jgi:hypothetical protein